MKKWTIPIMSLGLSVGLAAGAAHGADKETLKMAAGTKGGQIIVYNIIFKPAQRKLNKAFNKKFAKYGIKAKMIRSQSGKIANLYKQELRAGKVRMDAISTADPGMFLSFNRKNQLTRYCSPNYKDYRDWAVAKDCGYFYHTSWLQYISYNPELVKGGDIPNSWLDFHKPKWKGKISFGDPKIGGGHYYFVFTMYKLFGRDWFIKTRDNNAMMVRSHGTTNNKVKSGERHFGVNLSMLVRRDGPYPGGKNAPIKEVFPKEGGALLVAPMAITKDGPNPAGAKVLIDWLSSLEGQKVVSDKGKFSLRKDFTSVEGVKLSDLKYHWWDPNEMDQMRDKWTKDSLKILTGN